MNPFHLIKALLISVFEAFRRVPDTLPTAAVPAAARPPPKKERKPLPPAVKATFTALLLLVAAGFITVQFRHAAGDQPPSWLKIENHASPTIPSDRFKALVDECVRESARRRLPVGPVRFIALADTNGTSMAWSTETLTNPGFAPLAQVDRRFNLRRDTWVGYYRLDGTPMRYTQRTNPGQTNGVFILLHLDQPLAPGATQVVARVDQVRFRLRPNRAGNFEFFQGRFPPSSTVSGTGIEIPRNAELVRLAPISGTRKTEEKSTFVWWINTRTESNSPPMSVEFKLK